MQAGRKVAVAGATGRLGHHLVEVLAADGHDVVAMSRATGIDIVTGEGLAAALHGVVGASGRPEHAVRHPLQVGAVLLELPGQPLLLVHVTFLRRAVSYQ